MVSTSTTTEATHYLINATSDLCALSYENAVQSMSGECEEQSDKTIQTHFAIKFPQEMDFYPHFWVGIKPSKSF